MTIGDAKVQVDMVLDLICVHSYIGYTRLARAAERFRSEGGEVEIRFAPFELAPGAPTEGMPLIEALTQTFGEKTVQQLGYLVTEAAKDGLELHYDRAIATGTFGAHRLVAQAAHQGRGEAMVERLFRAHFTDGLNIGDAGTLARLAAEVGVTADDSGTEEVRAALRFVREAGVTSVPLFRIEGAPMLGEQPEEVLFAAMTAASRAGSVVPSNEPDADGVRNSPLPDVQNHVQRYLATDGADGHDYYGFPTLLLTTRGRRTGRQIRTPLIYGRDGDRIVLIASNGASPKNPHWYQNLVADPEVRVQVRADRFVATGRIATAEERPRLWELMAKIFPKYDEYATETTRDIPVVVLEPHRG
ncbi:Deazaflavin-dependent nitroreductase [Micromonospora sp. MW-13]|nr:Deazaflavin-dependent nitroreductase [Micromonospora sp. MW-13]